MKPQNYVKYMNISKKCGIKKNMYSIKWIKKKNAYSVWKMQNAKDILNIHV